MLCQQPDIHLYIICFFHFRYLGFHCICLSQRFGQSLKPFTVQGSIRWKPQMQSLPWRSMFIRTPVMCWLFGCTSPLWSVHTRSKCMNSKCLSLFYVNLMYYVFNVLLKNTFCGTVFQMNSVFCDCINFRYFVLFFLLCLMESKKMKYD